MEGNGISSALSLSPVGSCRKIESKSNSPVVIVMVLSKERPGLEKGDRYIIIDNNIIIASVYNTLAIKNNIPIFWVLQMPNRM